MSSINLRLFSCLLLFLGSLLPWSGLSAQAAPGGGEPEGQSAAAKWLAQVDAQMQENYEKKVLEPYKEGMEAARKAYQQAIEAAMNEAAAAGQEQEAAALRAEREAFLVTGRKVPSGSSPDPKVQKIRGNFRSAVAELDKTRFARAKPLHMQFDAALKQNIQALQQRQLSEDAALLSAKREEIAREWLPPVAVAASVNSAEVLKKTELDVPMNQQGVRDAVAWLLQSGARVSYKNGKRRVPIKTLGDLPSMRVDFGEVFLEAPKAEASEPLEKPKLSAADLAKLAPLRAVESLHIAGYEFGDDALVFLDAWRELHSCSLSEADVSNQLAVHLARFPMLESLTVRISKKLNSEFLVALGPVLQKLKVLSLEGTGMEDSAIPAISRFKHLTELNLGGTRITEKGLAGLADLKELKTLGLHNLEITPEGFGALARLRITGMTYLSTDMPDFAEKAGSLAKALPKLEMLRLIGSEISPEQVAALSLFNELRQLDLIKNTPLPGALGALAQLKRLEILRMHSPGISDLHLGELAGIRRLKSLDLTNTSVTDKGLIFLAKQRDLKSLALGGTPTTLAGVALLEKAIRGLDASGPAAQN
jgi:hypothetical protein